MTAADRLERDLADWFRETAAPALPHYTDDIVRQATHVRQPRRWTLLERWLPMSETVLQPVRLSSPVPWRPIALLALLALAMIAGVALVGASRPSEPAPFGVANNGLVAYEDAGDIFTVDPATGARRQVTTGLDVDGVPRWSPDGRRIAFLRGVSPSQVMIVDADGGNPVTSLDRIAETDEDGFEWAPDGSAVVATGRVVGADGLEPDGRINLVDATDGSVSSIGPAYLGFEFAWRPPDGRQLLFVGAGPNGPGLLLYAVDTGRVEVLPADLPDGQDEIRLAGWTADGTRYAYLVGEGDPETLSTRVVDIATGAFVDVPVAFGHLSNDGTRVAGLLGNHEGVPCVASVSGGECRPIGTRDQAPSALNHAGLFWSPDDRWVVTRPSTGWVRPQLLDPAGAIVDQPSWLADGAESWQRVP
jgi:Tol biopolymer transport system component